MSEDVAVLIQRSDLAIRAFQRASGSTRRSLAEVVGARKADVEARIVEIVDWLNRKEPWFSAHPDHPKFEQREDAWIEKLCHYESLCEAITRAQTVLGGVPCQSA